MRLLWRHWTLGLAGMACDKLATVVGEAAVVAGGVGGPLVGLGGGCDGGAAAWWGETARAR